MHIPEQGSRRIWIQWIINDLSGNLVSVPFCQDPISTEERTDDRPLPSTSSWWLSWRSGIPVRVGLKVLSVHHPRFTSRSFTRDWLRLRTVIHGFSHFNYAIATPWYTIHCRVCTSRLRGWLPPYRSSLPPFLLCKAVFFPTLPWIFLSFSQHFLWRNVSTCTTGTV